MKKCFNEGNFGLLFGVTAFIYFLFSGLTKDRIASTNDLVEIKATYLRHSFKDNIEFKNTTHEYYIWTKDYSNAFQIKADYLSIFDARGFLTRVRPGDKVIFTIPRILSGKLNSDENIFVTSIEARGRTYLDKTKALETERDLLTSNAEYFIGTGYLIVGLIVFFRRRFRLAKTTVSKSMYHSGNA